MNNLDYKKDYDLNSKGNDNLKNELVLKDKNIINDVENKLDIEIK